VGLDDWSAEPVTVLLLLLALLSLNVSMLAGISWSLLATDASDGTCPRLLRCTHATKSGMTTCIRSNIQSVLAARTTSVVTKAVNQPLLLICVDKLVHSPVAMFCRENSNMAMDCPCKW
jgi:hypothetical protein